MSRTAGARRKPRAALRLPVSLFAIAAALRVGAILASRGGLRGDPGYDPSVYYAASTALLHGRMPYANFVFLHPPGLLLVLSPFAALGRATTDLTGFVVGNLALALLGAGNAVLVYLVARRMGLSTTAAWLGGAFYAVWYGAVFAEVAIRLEPVGSFAFLCGMLAVLDERPGRGRRGALLAGIAFGSAVSVKIWWIVPLVVVGGWLLRVGADRARAWRYLAGVALTCAVVDGPFFVQAPRAMARMIVFAQLGRIYRRGPGDRLATISTLSGSASVTNHAVRACLAFACVALFLGLCVAAWRFQRARLLVVLALLEAVVLLAAPSFYEAYLDYLAPTLGLLVAAAAQHRLRTSRVTQLCAVAVAGLAAVTAASALLQPIEGLVPFPREQLAAALPHVRCVTSLEPIVLIQLDVLDSDLHHGCRVWPDPLGRTFTVDKPPTGNVTDRTTNRRWQRDALRFLRSGEVVVMRPDSATVLNWRTRRALRRSSQLITDVDRVTMYLRIVRSERARGTRPRGA